MGDKKLGRPRVAKLPKWQTTVIRALLREQLEERHLRRADFDALLERPARFTDNALNHTARMGADATIAILQEISTRFRVAEAGALLADVLRRVRGGEVPLPINVPADTVRAFVAAFERYAAS